MKKRAGWSVLLLVFCISLAACGGQEAQEQTGSEAAVSLTVTCADAVQQGNLSPEMQEALPQDGILFAQDAYPISDGITVLALLQQVMQEEKLPVEVGDGYVKGIGALYEGACGDTSGWLFRLNGEIPSVGAADCTLHKGDTVEWLYICDMNAFFTENGTDFSS